MDRIFFIVKGNDHVAMREATKRGIDINIDAVSFGWDECYCYAPISQKAEIFDWFHTKEGDTSQDGDCLWFSIRRN